MRCLACGSDEQEAGDYCTRCGRRLFAWLGDAFGSLELEAPVAAAGGSILSSRRTAGGVRSAGSSRAQASSTGKLVAGIVAILVLVLVSPGWAAALLVAVLVVLSRWPGVGWMTWSLLLGGTLLLGAVCRV